MWSVLRTQTQGVCYRASVETRTNWRYLVSPRLWTPAFLVVSLEDPFLSWCELLSTLQAFEDEFLVWLKILAVMGYFWKVLIRTLSVSGVGTSSLQSFLMIEVPGQQAFSWLRPVMVYSSDQWAWEWNTLDMSAKLKNQYQPQERAFWLNIWGQFKPVH